MKKTLRDENGQNWVPPSSLVTLIIIISFLVSKEVCNHHRYRHHHLVPSLFLCHDFRCLLEPWLISLFLGNNDECVSFEETSYDFLFKSLVNCSQLNAFVTLQDDHMPVLMLLSVYFFHVYRLLLRLPLYRLLLQSNCLLSSFLTLIQKTVTMILSTFLGKERREWEEESIRNCQITSIVLSRKCFKGRENRMPLKTYYENYSCKKYSVKILQLRLKITALHDSWAWDQIIPFFIHCQSRFLCPKWIDWRHKHSSSLLFSNWELMTGLSGENEER